MKWWIKTIIIVFLYFEYAFIILNGNLTSNCWRKWRFNNIMSLNSISTTLIVVLVVSLHDWRHCSGHVFEKNNDSNDWREVKIGDCVKTRERPLGIGNRGYYYVLGRENSWMWDIKGETFSKTQKKIYCKLWASFWEAML